jgi:hypothetical protein
VVTVGVEGRRGGLATCAWHGWRRSSAARTRQHRAGEGSGHASLLLRSQRQSRGWIRAWLTPARGWPTAATEGRAPVTVPARAHRNTRPNRAKPTAGWPRRPRHCDDVDLAAVLRQGKGVAKEGAEGATRAGNSGCTIYRGGGRLEEALGRRTRAPSSDQQWRLRPSAGRAGEKKGRGLGRGYGYGARYA